MLTRKALANRISALISEIRTQGYSPSKVVLFGSYSKGNPTDLSDIDLAIWDKKFTGCRTVDIEPIVSILSKYPMVELHTFSESDTENNHSFVKEIMRCGREVELIL
jgi:predicted nucleotidyltransferase